ncbi:discoidin domain-containing protein [Alteromonas stellipolaris]|uniref:galactose-binding domain-containing protein n=1 Tax=Alteromonas stellipolaris TaxID=233316 RepID=UPI002118A269|nr:discoidin domain-containing protein [Alteromonas stellipolaris]MCQ8850412.1 discoidin domain-containing protein [Alteromonas stellipolaris]
MINLRKLVGLQTKPDEKVEEVSKSLTDVLPVFKGVLNKQPLVIECDIQTRYVKLSLQVTEVFHLDEVEVFDESGSNIALNANVLVSSRYEDKYSGHGAVNGTKNGGSGFHTALESNPWLIIDLGEEQSIKKISVFNRDDRFFTRALSLMIEHSTNLVDWTIIYDNWESVKALQAQSETEFDYAIISALKLEPQKCQTYLNKLKSEGKEQEALGFQETINKLIYPLELAFGPHGFSRTFALRGDKEKERILNDIEQLLAWLNDEFDLPTFISSGTLLGIIRDGKLIEHDDDIDLCYISNQPTEADILAERERLVAFLTGKGCTVRKSDLAHYWCVTPAGLNVDIFTGFVEREAACMNPISRGDVKVSDVLPLQKEQVGANTLYIPANPEAVLACNYGEGWRAPDPLWTFDWARARQQFEFLYF